MTDVVVLGSGYGGTAAIKHLESAREDAESDLTWVSKDDYHLVSHELHRVIRNPDARDDVVVPVEEIIDPSTRFVQGEVTGLETDERVVELADGSTVDYDSALVDQDEDAAPLTRETVWAAILDEDTEHDGTPPATAEAAWEAAEIAAGNILRAIRGEDLESWHYTDKGTLVSVGDDVVAHDVVLVPVDTFGGEPAEVVKRAVGARWIGSISSWERAARAWPTL